MRGRLPESTEDVSLDMIYVDFKRLPTLQTVDFKLWPHYIKLARITYWLK
jgi:hypothetical protein